MVDCIESFLLHAHGSGQRLVLFFEFGYFAPQGLFLTAIFLSLALDQFVQLLVLSLQIHVAHIELA